MATEEKNPVDSWSVRAEIDTSAPFESVKEAANRFGGMGFWKPSAHKAPEKESELVRNHTNEAEIPKKEEEAAKLGQVLITKEKETLDVEGVKLKLQKETSEIDAALNQNEESQAGGEGAKFQVLRTMSEIEHKGSLKEAAKASETVAIAEIIKAPSKTQSPDTTPCKKNSEDVTLTSEEYSSIASKARQQAKEADAAKNEVEQQSPTLSIGQILSRKLLLTEEFANGAAEKRRDLLRSRRKLGDDCNDFVDCCEKPGKENVEEHQQLTGKGKKFGLARISRLVTKQGKAKNKKQSSDEI